MLLYSKGEQGRHVGENVAVRGCIIKAHIKFLVYTQVWITGWEMGHN